EHSPRALLRLLVADAASAAVAAQAGVEHDAGRHRGRAARQLPGAGAARRLLRGPARAPARRRGGGARLMADNWTYVIAAYGLAVVVSGVSWLRLGRRERELTALAAGRRDRAARSEREAVRTGPSPARPAPGEPAARAPRP